MAKDSKKLKKLILPRTKTYIPGFDKIVDGGLPKKDTILLAGPTGIGKTIFALQFTINGIKKEKIPTVFLTFEESADQIRETALTLGWDLKKYEDAGLLILIEYDPYRIEDIMEIIEGYIKKLKARRLVIDSISSLDMYIREESEIRDMIIQLDNIVRRNECTALFISEMNDEKLSRFGVEEFITDGVIVMNRRRDGDNLTREIYILKMRGVNHSTKIHTFKITHNGIAVG